MDVSAGGQAISPVIEPGGYALVFSGGTATGIDLQSSSTLVISSGGQVTDTSLVPGAKVVLDVLEFVSIGSATVDPRTDVLTVTQGRSTATLQLQGDYTGDSFTTSGYLQYLGGGASGGYMATAITEVKGNILVPVGSGAFIPLTTTTQIQTALAQQIVNLAAQTPGSQTVYLPNQGQVPQSTTLASPVLIDLPERLDTITGSTFVPIAHVLLDNAGATYVTGGTTDYGSDAVLVGGPSTITATAAGLENVVMTAGTTLAFIDQSSGPAADTVSGAANGTVVTAATGNAVINAGGGAESFFVDTSAGNFTLNGAASGGDAFTLVKDAAAGSANVLVTSFSPNDTLALHAYAGFNVQASSAGGALLALSDGSQVTFNDMSAATLQQAVRIV